MRKTEKLAVFSHLNGAWAACGLLGLTEDGGVPGEQIDKVQSAFRHIDSISTAELRKKLN